MFVMSSKRESDTYNKKISFIAFIIAYMFNDFFKYSFNDYIKYTCNDHIDI